MMYKKTIQEKKLCPHIKPNGNVHIFVSKINKDKQRIVSCLDCDTDLGVIYSIPLDYNVRIYKEGLKLAPLIVKRLNEMGFEFNNVVNSISFNELYKEKEMDCNHKDNEGKLDLSVYDGDIDCRRCSINFGRIIKAVEWFNTSDYQEGEIQIRKQFSFLLDLFKAEFEKFKIIVLSDKHRPLSKSDEQHFKSISEVNQDIKKIEKNNHHIHSIFTFVTEGLICSECSTLLATEIDSKFYWNVFDPKVRNLIKENVSLSNLFREWSTFNQHSSIDQTDIINNQTLKISDLESEVKRLEKIVIGLSERLVNETKIH